MRRNLLISTAVGLAIGLMAMPAVADWVTEDGHKMHFPQFPNVEGWDVNATQPIVLAEDWECTETGWVKDIHFWGSWMHGDEGEVTSFWLSIHEDIPVDTPLIPYSRPGLTLWEREITDFIVAIPVDPPGPEGWFDPSTGDYFESDHTAYYQYNVFLDSIDWFPQDSGTIYWLNISAVVAEPAITQWGWKSTLNHWNDDAVWAWWGDLDWVDMFEPPFIYRYLPGDVDGDGDVDHDDAQYLYDYLFSGGPAPPYSVGFFYPAADVNGDCVVNVQDYVYLLNYLDSGGPAPTYCANYPPTSEGESLDLAFVITGGEGMDTCEYYKLGYVDFCPNGMPDFDQKQDAWTSPFTGNWSWCGPVALANCIWWFDSKCEPNPIDPRPFWPGQPLNLNDGYPLVPSYDTGARWDDHDTTNLPFFITALEPMCNTDVTGPEPSCGTSRPVSTTGWMIGD